MVKIKGNLFKESNGYGIGEIDFYSYSESNMSRRNKSTTKRGRSLYHTEWQHSQVLPGYRVKISRNIYVVVKLISSQTFYS